MGFRSFFKSLGGSACHRSKANEETVRNHYDQDQEGSFPIIYLPAQRSTKGFDTILSPHTALTDDDASGSEEEENIHTTPASSVGTISPPHPYSHSHSSKLPRKRHRRNRPWKRLDELQEEDHEDNRHQLQQQQEEDEDNKQHPQRRTTKWSRLFRFSRSSTTTSKRNSTPNQQQQQQQQQPQQVGDKPTPLRRPSQTVSPSSTNTNSSSSTPTPTPESNNNIEHKDSLESDKNTVDVLMSLANVGDEEEIIYDYDTVEEEETDNKLSLLATVLVSSPKPRIIFTTNDDDNDNGANARNDNTSPKISLRKSKSPRPIKMKQPPVAEVTKHRRTISEISEISTPKLIYTTDEEQEKAKSSPRNKLLRKASSNKNPPVAEVTKHRRTISEVSDISNISFQSSAASSNPLEFSLETGFKTSKAAQFMAASEDIVASLQRQEHRQYAQVLQNNNNTIPNATTNPHPQKESSQQQPRQLQQEQNQPYHWKAQETSRNLFSPSSKCLILLMDPRKRIFEIVQVPYRPESTTVGDLLDQLPTLATDKRLARLHCTGVCQGGVHVANSTAPLDMILASSRMGGKPLYAVPARYTATQIQSMGDSLLQTPNVAKLLEDQWAKLKAAQEMPTRGAAGLDPTQLILASLEQQQQQQQQQNGVKTLHISQPFVDDDDDDTMTPSLSSHSTLSPRRLLNPSLISKTLNDDDNERIHADTSLKVCPSEDDENIEVVVVEAGNYLDLLEREEIFEV